ncbi:MAG: carbohydrate ABC transporter permease [Candidatus Nanopelagicaceae bacterium]
MFYKISRLVALTIFTVLIIVPVSVVVFGTFKGDLELMTKPLALPEKWTLDNYRTLIEGGQIVTNFRNSTIVTLASVVITLALASLASFGIARMFNKSAKVLLTLFLLGLTIPAATSIIAIFQLFQSLNLLNTLHGLVLINVASTLPISVFILTAFFQQIPNELYEAAAIDGAGPFKLYRSVALPLSRPSMGAVAIFLFVINWNDLLYPLLLITQSDLKTLPLALLDFRGEYAINFSMIFTAVMVASLPMVIMYLLMQRTFVAGLTAGAVKG